MLAVAVAEAVAIALLGMLVVGLLRSHAEILRALHRLGVDLDPTGRDLDNAPLRHGQGPDRGHGHGAPPVPPPVRIPDDARAHDLTGERLDGSTVALGICGTDHDTLLVFLSATCGSCQPFWDSLRAGAVPEGLRAVVVAQEYDDRNRLTQLAGDTLDVVLSDAAWREYAVPGSPHAVLVHGPTARIVGEGTAATFDQLMSLLGQARQSVPGSAPAASGGNPWTAGRDNAVRVDAELARSGIGAGHPSLYPTGSAAGSAAGGDARDA